MDIKAAQSAQTDTSTTPTGGSKTSAKTIFSNCSVTQPQKSDPETLENDAFIAQTAQFRSWRKCPSW